MFPGNTRILIVDDMKTMRVIIKKTLTELGFKSIQEADDGDVAWNAIEAALTAQAPFELIVSDWNMARMKGIDLLRKVRQHKVIGKTPFLMVTAESDVAQVKEAIQAGVSNYVTKPFTGDALNEKLIQVWNRHFKK